MRFVLASLLLVGLASPVAADDAKKKDDTTAKKDDTAAKKDEKKDEVAKCLIVKAGEKDVAPPVEVDYVSAFKSKTKVAMTPAVAAPLCKSQSNKPASEWIRDHGVCDGKKLTWKYTVTFGTPGKEQKFEQNVICAKKK